MKLGLDVTPEAFAKLQARAKAEGKSVEQVASEIFRVIFGCIAIGAMAFGVLIDKDPNARLRSARQREIGYLVSAQVC